MHELGVVFHVIDAVEAVAAENRVSKIYAVVLEIGEVTGIVDDYLTDCWSWAVKKHPVLTECELEIEHITAINHCDECGTEYSALQHGKECPFCGSGNTWLRQGKEFVIKELRAEPPEADPMSSVSAEQV